MAVKFYVNQFRNLMAEMDGEKEIMIAPVFMQGENGAKAANYLRGVAEVMTRLYNAGQVEEASALMAEAEAKITSAQTAEKFMREVNL